MSKATKRKHVTKEVQEDLSVPNQSESIVQLVDSRGNNLHEVMDSAGVYYLVTMPVKFRRNVWVKKGNFVLVQPIPEGDKVKAEIVKILTKDHIKFYRAQNCWPEIFNEKIQSASNKMITKQNESDSASENEDDLFVNTNRNPHNQSERKSSSSDSSDSE